MRSVRHNICMHIMCNIIRRCNRDIRRIAIICMIMMATSCIIITGITYIRMIDRVRMIIHLSTRLTINMSNHIRSHDINRTRIRHRRRVYNRNDDRRRDNHRIMLVLQPRLLDWVILLLLVAILLVVFGEISYDEIEVASVLVYAPVFGCVLVVVSAL